MTWVSIDYIGCIMSKRHGFIETFTIYFKYKKNWKRAGIQIWVVLEDRLWEIRHMWHFYRNN